MYYSSSLLSAALLVLTRIHPRVFASAIALPWEKHVDSTGLTRPSIETQMETVQAVIDGYNAWDTDAILAYRAPDCQHQVLPSSMGRAAQSNDEYRTYLSAVMPQFSNFTVVVHSAVHDPETHSCVVHASSTVDTEIGQYANEYMLSLEFTEDGKKVK
ncbi:hypothetical protein E8E12_000985, partial [Didymella heteroderae]